MVTSHVIIFNDAALQRFILLQHKQKLESCCRFLSPMGNSLVLRKTRGSSGVRSVSCIGYRAESWTLKLGFSSALDCAVLGSCYSHRCLSNGKEKSLGKGSYD